jgi:O-antigen/teichoic acid export membrane protein
VLNLGKLILQGENLIGAKRRDDSLRASLRWNTGGTFTLKVASTGLIFLMNLLLARLLGTTGYGTYAYALAWFSILSVLCVFGLDKLLVREVSIFNARSAWGLMRGILRWSNFTALVGSVGIALLAGVIIWIISGRLESQMTHTLLIAVVMLPLIVFLRLRQAAMRGLHYVVGGQLPEMLIMPVSFFIIIGLMYLFMRDVLSAPVAMAAQVAAVGFALIVGVRQLQVFLPRSTREARPVYQGSTWMHIVMPLVFLDSMTMINSQIDIVLLGLMKSTAAVGVYAVAKKGAGLVAFVLIAVNIALAPTIASMYAAGEMDKLQRMITKSARVILIGSLPVAIILILFGHWFLLFFFGQDFLLGEKALAILGGAQLVNAATGSVGILLIMTGYERDAAMCVGISALLNFILNASFIPRWGLEGAAAATATTIVFWNILLAVLVYKRLGIHSTALGEIKLWKEV